MRLVMGDKSKIEKLIVGVHVHGILGWQKRLPPLPLWRPAQLAKLIFIRSMSKSSVSLRLK